MACEILIYLFTYLLTRLNVQLRPRSATPPAPPALRFTATHNETPQDRVNPPCPDTTATCVVLRATKLIVSAVLICWRRIMRAAATDLSCVTTRLRARELTVAATTLTLIMKLKINEQLKR